MSPNIILSCSIKKQKWKLDRCVGKALIPGLRRLRPGDRFQLVQSQPDSKNNTCENLFLVVHINYKSIQCIIKWFRNSLLKKSPFEELKTYSKLLFTWPSNKRPSKIFFFLQTALKKILKLVIITTFHINLSQSSLFHGF